MDGECHESCTLLNKVRHDDRSINEKTIRAPQYAYQHLSPQFINHLDRLFAISPAIKDVYSKNNVNKELIDIVPNCYDPGFTQQVDTDIDILSDDFVILYVGRLREEKGVDLLIDAAKTIDMSNKSINIVGDGPLREELEREVKSAELFESTRFHGWVDQSELSSYYKKSDIFVHPGRWPEPFGRTILEALQCNCPPVVSDVGAPPWIINDAGRTFKRSDVKSLSAVIQELQYPQSRIEYEIECKNVIENYNPDDIISDIEIKYDSIIS
jgi:glycosyltransferase involved in cell wall biosynthesis